MQGIQKTIKRNRSRLFTLLVVLLIPSFSVSAKQFLSHQLNDNQLEVQTDQGTLVFTPLTQAAVEVKFEKPGVKQLPSFAIAPSLKKISFNLNVSDNHLTYFGDSLKVLITKQPFHIQYFEKDVLLSEHSTGFFHYEGLRGVNFNITDEEMLIGGGQRVLGMDRRGHELPLYNKTHWGYTTESKQMYFGLPAVMSSKGYALVFDNSARGAMDLGANQSDVLQFEANAGRNAYLFVAGSIDNQADYPKLINRLTDVTGKQPLPPSWSLGNFASRFGYRSEQQVREVVSKFEQADIPLDAVVLDLYWFGKEMKGYMGNLDWDRKNWPDAEKMIADFKEKGIQTVVITEPFILQTSKNWQSAVDAGALAKDMSGKKAKSFDMFFGRAGLVDVFDKKGQTWFWEKYRNIVNFGVEGLWGDLGEPEVHPTDLLHAIGTADEVHNAYGHQWARMLADNFTKDFPDKRLFLLMRSGFMGSQRYGMIPWTGDVSRSWGGLKPQVELSLQMGMMGLAWTHSDLGGFGGDKDTLDKELYIRWMQYGVFQPVYRPHAFETVPSEPVFHDKETQDILREFIKLRYRLLPYNYTLAYENTVSGMPLMRPLMFAEASNKGLFYEKDSYLWGDSFFVHPVTDPGVKQITTYLPKGVWFDYWHGSRFDGGAEVSIPVTLQDIPVLVKAGSFIPFGPNLSSTAHFRNDELNIHYFHDASVNKGAGRLYEDDGTDPNAINEKRYLLTNLNSNFAEQILRITLTPEGNGFDGLPEKRQLKITINNLSLSQTGRISVRQDGKHPFKIIESPDGKTSFSIAFNWNNKPVAINIPVRAEPKESL